MFNNDFFRQSKLAFYLSSILIVIVSPCLVGLMLAKLSDKNILVRILQIIGYNPINQMIGYILSGDPTYITSHNNARSIIRKLERDELLEELLKNYLEKNIVKLYPIDTYWYLLGI